MPTTTCERDSVFVFIAALLALFVVVDARTAEAQQAPLGQVKIPTQSTAPYLTKLLPEFKTLTANPAPFSVDLGIDYKSSSKEKGEDFRYLFRTNKVCYIALFTTWRGTQHVMVQLFPNGWQSSSKVESNKTYKVPREDSFNYYLSAAPPKDRDGIIFAIASSKPIATLENAKTKAKFERFSLFANSVRFLEDLLAELKDRKDWVFVEKRDLPRPTGMTKYQ